MVIVFNFSFPRVCESANEGTPGVEGFFIRGSDPPHTLAVDGTFDRQRHPKSCLSPAPPTGQHLEPGWTARDLALAVPQLWYLPGSCCAFNGISLLAIQRQTRPGILTAARMCQLSAQTDGGGERRASTVNDPIPLA